MANTHATLTSLFTDIANKIRAKKGTSASIKADDFPSEIESIQTGITPSGSQTFTENGTYDVTSIAQAIVNVSGGGGPDIAWGEVTPNASNETIVIPTGLTQSPMIVIIAKEDVFSTYKITSLMGYATSFAGKIRGYNGDRNSQGDMSRYSVISWNGGTLTLTTVGATDSRYRFFATGYYWMAINDAPGVAMMLPPSGDDIERK